MILEAEGVRQSAIFKAEGEAEAIPTVADGTKCQKFTVAQREGEAIQTVFGAIHNGNSTNGLIAIKYLEALGNIASGRATRIFLPLETSGVLGSIAGVAELLKDRTGGPKGPGESPGQSGEPGQRPGRGAEPRGGQGSGSAVQPPSPQPTV
jgi:hypothetical protein